MDCRHTANEKYARCAACLEAEVERLKAHLDATTANWNLVISERDVEAKKCARNWLEVERLGAENKYLSESLASSDEPGVIKLFRERDKYNKSYEGLLKHFRLVDEIVTCPNRKKIKKLREALDRAGDMIDRHGGDAGFIVEALKDSK